MLLDLLAIGAGPQGRSQELSKMLTEALQVEQSTRQKTISAQAALTTIQRRRDLGEAKGTRIAEQVALLEQAKELHLAAEERLMGAIGGHFTTAKALTADQIRQRLKPGQWLLSYCFARHGAHLVAMPPVGGGECRAFRLATDPEEVSELVRIARETRAMLSTRPEGLSGEGALTKILVDCRDRLLPKELRAQAIESGSWIVVADGLPIPPGPRGPRLFILRSLLPATQAS